MSDVEKWFQLQLLLVPKGEKAAPEGEIIVTGAGTGKKSTQPRGVLTYGNKDCQHHREPQETSDVTDSPAALERGRLGKETPRSPLPSVFSVCSGPRRSSHLWGQAGGRLFFFFLSGFI